MSYLILHLFSLKRTVKTYLLPPIIDKLIYPNLDMTISKQHSCSFYKCFIYNKYSIIYNSKYQKPQLQRENERYTYLKRLVTLVYGIIKHTKRIALYTSASKLGRCDETKFNS